jgi:hypothetical protein
MQPGAIAQILRSVLPLTAQTQGQAIIDQWGERLRIGNLHQTRRHLLETAQNTLRHYPNVPGLRDFYNTLLDPCLDQRAWSDAISRLQQTLTDGHSRGEIWAEFVYHLLDPENLRQRTIPEAISELEALRTYPDGFYEIPPASRVSESRRSISRQLARIGNEKVAQLRQTRETQERDRLSLLGTGDRIIEQVQTPPKAHSELKTSAFRALRAVLHRYWSEAKWATLVFFALTGIMLYLAYGPVDHLVASLPPKLLERIADLLFTATLTSWVLATGMVLQETRKSTLRQA